MTTKGLLALSCGLFLLACAREEPAEEAIEPDTFMTEPAGISLADVAGTWNVRVMNEAGDSVTGYRLVATSDPAGWTINFPNREPIPIRIVTVEGDSVVTEAGPFESAVRPGVMVSTETVFRLEGDRLVSRVVAHYQTTDPDSVAHLRSEGRRAP